MEFVRKVGDSRALIGGREISLILLDTNCSHNENSLDFAVAIVVS